MSTIQENQHQEIRNFQREKDKGFWSPNAIFEVENLKSNEILVYMTLCYFADYETGEAYPAIDTIAKRSKLSRRTVINVISSLVEKGYILKEDADPSKGRKYKSNHYIVLTPEVKTEDSEQKVMTNRRNVKIRERKTDANNAPLPVQEMHPSVDNLEDDAPFAPLPVQEMHHTSAGDAPELNYLTSFKDLKDLKNVCMYDAHESNDSNLKPSEKEKIKTPEKKSKPVSREYHFGVKTALRQYALNRLYKDHHQGMGETEIDAIFCDLVESFPNNLNGALVQKACELYEEKTDPTILGRLKFDVKDCKRLFKKQYERAILLQNEEIYEFEMMTKQQPDFQRMA